MKTFILLSFILFWTSTFSQKNGAIYEKVFQIFQTKCIFKNGFQMQLKRVFDDSRCPDSAQCIWAGEVSIEIIAFKNNKITEVKVMTLSNKNFEENKKWFSDKYQIVIKEISVCPNLKQGTLIDPKAYYVKIVY